VIIHLEIDPDCTLTCSVCGKASSGYDIRRCHQCYLDARQYRTVLVADMRRVGCEDHGVHQIDVSCSDPGARFTALSEALAVDWMKEGSLLAVCRLLEISWDEVAGMQERAVRRGLERREAVSLKRIGVDETSFQKGANMSQLFRTKRAVTCCM